MINLYDILNIAPNATEKSIQAGIAMYRLRDDANEQVVQAARSWLLNPAVRAQYDAKLFAHLGVVTPDPEIGSHDGTTANNYHIDKKRIPTTQVAEFEHLYQFLGIRTKASYADIADAIDEAVLEGLNGKTIQLAREQLLDADSRAAYDAEHGIESAAAIMAHDEPVATLPHTNLRLPTWLSAWWRKSSPSTTAIATEHTSSESAAAAGNTSASGSSHAAGSATVTTGNHALQDALTPVATAPMTKAKPLFKRDNWYHFLGIRGDASFEEIKVALHRSRLKGRDHELIRQAQNMLLKPGNRRLYDKQNNMAAFVAAQNGDVSAKTSATDYRPAPQLLGLGLEKCLLALVALIGLASGLMPWAHTVAGYMLLPAWPLLCSCLFTLACCACGYLQDPICRSAHRILMCSLLPAAAMFGFIGFQNLQFGAYWGMVATVGLLLVPALFGQQSKNVSYRAKGQQLFALAAVATNITIACCSWWILRSAQ